MKKHILILFLFLCSRLVFGQTHYNHILITNDDGKEDSERLLALAMGVKDVADRISVIVSDFDRSGTSNRTAYGKYQSTFEVTCTYVDHENNIAGYTIPDYPADCVLLGLSGFFGDDRPDLVLSGINGGANIGPSWFGSGTIGAVRTAAYLGVKAIALSGFDSDNENSFTIVPQWVAKLISSGFIDALDKNSYLTIGFPEPMETIKGVKLAERRVSYELPENIHLEKIHGNEPYVFDNTTIWTVGRSENPLKTEMKYDDTHLHEGFIIITPMSIDENNCELMQKLLGKKELIPEFVL